MRRLAITVVALLGFVPAVEALTIRDVIELSRAGLGEEVLLAMIEVDGGVYQIDTATLKSLKAAGVPERVIVALVRSGRERPAPPIPVAAPAEAPRAPEPQVVVIDHQSEQPPREVVVPVPIYVPVAVTRGSRRHVDKRHVPVESTYVPFQSGPPLHTPHVPKSERVYWGFGGKLRPDAWQPDARHDGHKPDGRSRKP